MANPGGPGAGGIRPPVGDGSQVSRQGAAQPSPHGIADGSLVEGLVTAKNGDMYQVRIGSQTMSALSSIPLFTGQRFRAVWDASASPPMLRLQAADMALISRFTGRDQQVALALVSRGMPVNDETMWNLRRCWMRSEGDPARLGALAELWARGADMTDSNVALMMWYMELTPEHAMQIWKRLRERLRERRFASQRDMLSALKEEGDEEALRFLQAHALAGRPARGGLDPSMLLAPAWWPVDGDEDTPVMARVSLSCERKDGRQAWWMAFEMEGNSLGCVKGDIMTNGRALSANIRLADEKSAGRVRDALPALREDLSKILVPMQYIGVGVSKGEDRRDGASFQALDMEL
jgi:hypothetical protein